MKHALILPLGLAAVLAGCNNSDHTIVAGGPVANDDYNAAAESNIVLPPSIAASKSYRCSDGSIVYVDYLSDGKSANIRTDKSGAPNLVSAAEAGKPMSSANGFSLNGSSGASSVKIGVAGKSAQTCNG
ncbi:MAG TPA: hypothetical protein VNR68_01610 [Sphingomicrobium sp.]|nr:hypothetical protein [Sphingomicrobium sp.]